MAITKWNDSASPGDDVLDPDSVQPTPLPQACGIHAIRYGHFCFKTRKKYEKQTDSQTHTHTHTHTHTQRYTRARHIGSTECNHLERKLSPRQVHALGQFQNQIDGGEGGERRGVGVGGGESETRLALSTEIRSGTWQKNWLNH